MKTGILGVCVAIALLSIGCGRTRAEKDAMALSEVRDAAQMRISWVNDHNKGLVRGDKVPDIAELARNSNDSQAVLETLEPTTNWFRLESSKDDVVVCSPVLPEGKRAVATSDGRAMLVAK